MEVPVPTELLELVDQLETGFDVPGERDRDRAVQARDGRRIGLDQRVVDRCDRGGIRAFRVAGGDRRLELVRPRSPERLRATEDTQALLDLRPVPERAVLVGEEDELARGVDARVAARVLEEEESEEPERLRLVRHEDTEELRQPDRLGAQIGANEIVAGGCGVPLVEDEVEDAQDVGHAVGEELVGRHAERDSRLPHAPLGADEALCQRWLRDEEGARDLVRREAADLAQRERDAGLDRERRVTAGEQEREPLVRNGAHVRVLFHGTSSRRARSSTFRAKVRSRRMRSIAPLRAVATIHAPGDRGVPSRGQRSTALAKASWTASSARVRSPRTRVRIASARGHSSLNVASSDVVTAPRWAGSERAGLRGGDERGDADRLVEVRERRHEQPADLLLRLGERPVRDHALAVDDPDDLRVRRRGELAALHGRIRLPHLLEEREPARHRLRTQAACLFLVELRPRGLVSVDEQRVPHVRPPGRRGRDEPRRRRARPPGSGRPSREHRRTRDIRG